MAKRGVEKQGYGSGNRNTGKPDRGTPDDALFERLKTVMAEKQRLEVVLATIPSAVVIIERPDGRVSYVNGRAIELYGIDPRGLQMKDHARRLNLLTLDGVLYAPKALPASRAMIAGEVVRDEELIIERPDGSRVTVSASAAPIRNENGEITAAVGVFYDVTARKGMEDALKHSRDELEEMVALRTEQLTGLSRRLVDIQELERRMIARELHDEIGQSLTALKIFLDKHPGQAEDELDPRLVQARQTVNDLIQGVRNLSMNLRPTMLDDLGLLPTLLWHFETYTTKTNIAVIFKHAGLRRQLPLEAAVVAYRVIQEALSNVARYAEVSEILVCVRREINTLYVEIEDHGVGFDLEDVSLRSTAGIVGMRERLLSLNGSFKLESLPGGGTYVLGEIPLTSQKEALRRRRRVAVKKSADGR